MIWGLPGSCVLVSDDPTATRLSDLASDQRSTYLESMARLAGAVEAACAEADPAFRRVDVEILGSADDFLHTHIWPRYEWEPADLVWRPVWLYRLQHWCDPAYSETRVDAAPICGLAFDLGSLSSGSFGGAHMGDAWRTASARPGETA